MSETEAEPPDRPTQPTAEPAAAPPPEPGPGPDYASPGRGQNRPRAADEGRRRRGGPDRRQAGFGDEIDRSYCARFVSVVPPDFPIQHRYVAARRPMVVARRAGALLLCDSAHPGGHHWPNHEPVLDEERATDRA